MTDFYSVLQRAVSSLPDGSGPQRRAVYDKARKALLKQLQSFDPPLPSAEVTAQRLALEDAIRKIENEIARQIRTRRAVQTAIPAPQAVRAAGPAGETETEREARRRAELQRQREEAAELLKSAVSTATLTPDLGDEGEREPVEAALPVPVPVPVGVPVPVPLPAAMGPAAMGRGEPPRLRARDSDEDDVLFEHESEPDAVPVPRHGRRAEPPLGSQTVEAEYDEVDDADAPAGEPAPSRKEERRRKREEERRLKAERRAERGGRGKREPASVPPQRETARRSFAARVALPVAILCLLAGAVYAAVTHGDVLLAAIDRLEDGSGATRPPIAADDGDPVVVKNSDRLLSSTVEGEETRAVQTTPWPPRGEAAVAEPAPAGMEPTAPAGDPSAPPTAEVAGDPAGAPDEMSDEEARAEAQPFSGDEPSTPAEDLVAAVDGSATAAIPPAERPSAPVADFSATGRQPAVLYEEAAQAGEPGSVLAGSVEWSMIRQSIGGGDPEPVVLANAAVPNRGLDAAIQIRENRDPALPASHLIEISFDIPEDFAGGGIKSVPGLIMKETEQARGEALRGAAAKVSDGLFWIALSEDANDRALNLRLLRERDWIDIPILYDNDRRAILTIRKGNDGYKSVNAAIQAWSPG